MKKMEKGKIITIDGPSNTGKTTVCEEIIKMSDFIMIKESGRRIKHPKPSTNLSEELYNQKFYFKEEIKRLLEAEELSKKGNNVILDRGPLSILSVAYAFEKTERYKAFENAQDLYKSFSKQTQIVDLSLFFETNLEEINQRNKKVKLSEEWMNDKFIFYQMEFNRKLNLENTRSQIIDTTNNQTQETARYIINLVEELD